MASQVTRITIVYSIICSGVDKKKHQSSTSLAFVRGVHRWPVISAHRGSVTRKMFPYHDVIMMAADAGHTMFNIKMPSYQYRKSHCGDKTILRPSYLHNGISYTGKTTYLYWIRAQGISSNSTDLVSPEYCGSRWLHMLLGHMDEQGRIWESNHPVDRKLV